MCGKKWPPQSRSSIPLVSWSVFRTIDRLFPRNRKKRYSWPGFIRAVHRPALHRLSNWEWIVALIEARFNCSRFSHRRFFFLLPDFLRNVNRSVHYFIIGCFFLWRRGTNGQNGLVNVKIGGASLMRLNFIGVYVTLDLNPLDTRAATLVTSRTWVSGR